MERKVLRFGMLLSCFMLNGRYAKEPGFLGGAFGSKEKYKGICVFFDSYDNDGSVCISTFNTFPSFLAELFFPHSQGDNPSLNIAYNDNDREHDASGDGRSVRVAHHSINLRSASSNSLGIILWKKLRMTFTSAERSGTGRKYGIRWFPLSG